MVCFVLPSVFFADVSDCMPAAYDMAKRIIHLVCKVGEKLNNDPDTKDLLRLYFLSDYNVSVAETIIPGVSSAHVAGCRAARRTDVAVAVAAVA